MLEVEKPSSESSPRWPFSIGSTPPVYQALGFPMTPPVYSFPLFTALDDDHLNERLKTQTSEKDNSRIAPHSKQDGVVVVVEAVQSIATDPKFGKII